MDPSGDSPLDEYPAIFLEDESDSSSKPLSDITDTYGASTVPPPPHDVTQMKFSGGTSDQDTAPKISFQESTSVEEVDRGGEDGLFKDGDSTTSTMSFGSKYCWTGRLNHCIVGAVCFIGTIIAISVAVSASQGGGDAVGVPTALTTTTTPMPVASSIAVPTASPTSLALVNSTTLQPTMNDADHPFSTLFCPEQFAAYDECIDSLEEERDACDACFQRAKDDSELAASCDRINFLVCHRVERACETVCGTCNDAFVDLNACFHESAGLCPIDCETAPQTEPPPLCEDEIRSYRACLDTHTAPDESQACIDCVNSAVTVADEQVMCVTYNALFCAELGRCEECGECLDEMEDWRHCLSVTFHGCESGIDCDKPPEPCDDSMHEYHACLSTFDNLGQVNSCLGCLQGALDAIQPDQEVCVDVDFSFCSSWTECQSCGPHGEDGCKDEAEKWMNCLFVDAGCEQGLDCQSVSNPCIDETVGYETCLSNVEQETDVQACVSCVNQAAEAHFSRDCALSNADFCSDFEFCDACMLCSDEMNAFVQCKALHEYSCVNWQRCNILTTGT